MSLDLGHREAVAEAGAEGGVTLRAVRQGEAVVHQVIPLGEAGLHHPVVVGHLQEGADGHPGEEVGPRVEAVAPQGRLGDQVGRREARPAAHTGLEEDK